MFRKMLFISLLAGTGLCFAALPPLYDSVNEITGFLQHPDLSHCLSSAEVIQRIERTPGGFLVTTNYSQVKVDVQIKAHAEIMGPVEYKYTFQKV